MVDKKLHFKTNVLLKDLVGKDLINDDNIAIVELVKNSFDAGSKEVLVRFTNFQKSGISTSKSQIVISDRGSGMDFSDIEHKWLNIAYSEKKYTQQKAGAYLAGNKGIGRFSCDRLGKRLDLLTRTKGGQLLHLPINWSDFEIENKAELTIQQISLTAQVLSPTKAKKISGIEFPAHGTSLVISELRSPWNRDQLSDLKISLEKFLNPNQLYSRDKFRIYLSVPGLKEKRGYADRINGEIQNQIFKRLKFNSTYIEAHVSSAKTKTVQYKLWHEGEKVFDLVERNDSYPLLRDIYAVIYYLNPYKKSYFKRQTGVCSVDFGSIFLFLNGFRIAPYGSYGDDWLGIDIRKGQGTQRYLGSRDIVGRIEITGTATEFTPVSSREGLKGTPAFNQLRKKFFLDVLRKLERFVVDGLNWDSVSREIAQDLSKSDGYDWKETREEYTESWERKKQRIVGSLIKLLGASPERIISFWFNPSLLEDVYETRTDDVRQLLADVDKIGVDKVEPKLNRDIRKIRKYIEQKDAETKEARQETASLRGELAEQEGRVTELTKKTETYRAQTLFLKTITSFDTKQLITYHHEINTYSISIANYLERALKLLAETGNNKAIEIIQKIVFVNKKIATLAQHASKANFRAETDKMLTDIPAFVEQYLTNVAPEFSATEMGLSIENLVNEPFEIKASRIELSILIDNIITNAKKAGARKMVVRLSKASQNRLVISFVDNGQGISEELPSAQSMFEPGITTTSGSGLGLAHAKDVVEEIGGTISAIPVKPTGLEIRVEVTR